MDKKDNFLIIDGNSLAHRAYHSISPNLKTQKGESVNAVFGFTKMLLKSIEVFSPKYVACVFDYPAPTFRKEIYNDYKKNRKKMDEELSIQFKRIKEILNAFNIPIYEKAGFEGDDIIGSIENKLKDTFDGNILILSGDKDLLQLLNRNTKVILSSKNFSNFIVWSNKIFKDEYGFDSKYFIQFKAIYGDTSDSIPGVKGIGEKGANELIKKYKTIDNIYKNIHEVSSRYNSKLIESKDIAYISLDLSKIKSDIDMKFHLEENLLENFNPENILAIFKELEFKSLLNNKIVNKIALSVINQIKDTEIDINLRYINSVIDFDVMIKNLSKQKLLIMDIEEIKTNKDINSNKSIFVVYLASNLDNVFKFNLDSNNIYNSDMSIVLSRKDNMNEWGRMVNIFGDKVSNKVVYSKKLHLYVFQKLKIKIENIIFDECIAAYLLNYPSKSVISLYNYVFDSNISDKTLNLDQKFYLIFNLYSKLNSDVGLNHKVNKLFHSIEMPLVDVLFEMENKGITLDTLYLKSLKSKIDKKILENKNEIFKITQVEFNIGSPKQLSEIIFNKLKMPKGRKIKTGYSIDDRYINSYSKIYPVLKYIKNYRELLKFKNTYIESLPLLIDKNSKIHTSFNQTVASSGRLSSSDPNLQNIPIRSELGNEIRKSFVSGNNSVLVSFDYSQIDLRLLAHFSEDPVLIDLFIKNIDIHVRTAQLIFDKTDITKEERRIAKTINFGIVYGISAFGLSEQLGIDTHTAKEFIDKYFENYKRVKEYIEEEKLKVIKNHVVETYFGRQRFFRAIDSVNWQEREAMLREAINMPIQGTNADIIKIGMIEIFKNNNYKANLLLQVHDELIFEFFFDEIYNFNEIGLNSDFINFCTNIKKILENVVKLRVPLIVDISYGKNWGEMVPFSLNK